MALPRVLIECFRRLFRFQHRDGDGQHSFKQDDPPLAHSFDARWRGEPARSPLCGSCC